MFSAFIWWESQGALTFFSLPNMKTQHLKNENVTFETGRRGYMSTNSVRVWLEQGMSTN